VGAQKPVRQDELLRPRHLPGTVDICARYSDINIAKL
jgi:hypothetical protein